MASVTTVATTIAANLTRVLNTTMASMQTTTLATLANLTTTANTTTVTATSPNSTVFSTVLPSVSAAPTTMAPSTTVAATATTSAAATSTISVTKASVVTSTVSKLTTQLPLPTGPSSGLVFLSLILFVVAVAVIGKIIYSNRKRRSDLIGGTARWRLAASQQSGAGPQQTAASYAPMGGSRQASATNGLDTPGPDRLDWERQFFDDTEATVPSRLQLDLSRT